MKHFVYLLGFVLILSSCARKSNSQKALWDPMLKDSSYVEIYDRWTERDSVYSNFDMSAVADVTYFNWELRQAYVDAVTSDYRLSEEQAKALAAEELSEDEAFDTFIVSLRTREYGWSNLGSKDALWSLQLEDASGEKRIRPKSIEKINTKDERARQYYRKMDRFSETYKVRFPKEKLADSEKIKLFITGPVGQLEFSFNRPEKIELP